jgi:predicted MPP superfamily phosphohydrolase
LDSEAEGLYDLQLSGHTHKGQIFPFGLLTRLVYYKDAGYARLPKGSQIYVSRGTGTWGPPIRILAPPEVTVIDLVPESTSR